MRWAYGITTVPARRDTLFLPTLASLARAGFEKPHLFIDGAVGEQDFPLSFYTANLPKTYRYPPIKTHGNWVLGIYELYIRNPDCDRYAMFQDDVMAAMHLREYLEECDYPERGFLNLYTHPSNYFLGQDNPNGWYLSNQRGKGAQGLVFSRDALVTLLKADHLIVRCQNMAQIRNQNWRMGQKNLDGGIGDSMRKSGWKEYVHRPSLLQHSGERASTMENAAGHIAVEFAGEECDARTFLRGRGKQ